MPDARTRAVLRANAIGLALLAAALVLDVVYPLATPPHTGAFVFGVFVAIYEAVSWAFHAFASTAVTVLLAAYQFLRTGFILIGRAMKTGLFEAGRATAKLIRSTRALWDRVILPGLKWANDKLLRLEHWLHNKVAPVLRWLAELKRRLDLWYAKYIKPITDTIDFIRLLNRTLETFHVHILSRLDDVLTRIEQRIEEPFLWLRAKITELENWIDRIVTLDGFFQRLTLIRSMGRYAPDWIRQFYNAQRVRPGKYQPLPSDYGPVPLTVADMAKNITDYVETGGGTLSSEVSRLHASVLEQLASPPQ
jgi:hypothetical protein